MKKIPSLVFLILFSIQSFCQSDTVGSGRALHLDGNDDYVDLGNIYDDLQFPLTVSVWVYVDPSSQYLMPIFVSQDNSPTYNGFWFCFSQTNLFLEYGDGRGEQSSAYRRGKSATLPTNKSRWIFVTAVVKGTFDIQLFADGHDIGGSVTGSSNQPMASAFPNDVAKIGYLSTNSAVHHFPGLMDELRIWNRALSVDEIRENMCRRLNGNETGLIGYWNFDEVSGDTLKDLSSNGYHGILKGNPSRVFSGAPVGDEGVFLYTSNWTGETLSLDGLTVSNVTPSTYGAQIYKINTGPSQTGGLDEATLKPPYYGVFLADDGSDHFFDLSFGTETLCSSYVRQDNSVAHWSFSDTFSQIPTRTEIIPVSETTDFRVDLGPDRIVCDSSVATLAVSIDPQDKSFLWSNGATGTTIHVSTSGLYSLKVTGGCVFDEDSVHVQFLFTPPQFSLGEDEEVCELEPRMLSPALEEGDGYTYTWQDGSTEKSFLATDVGTYWVEVKNFCGGAYDTITFSRKMLKDLASYNFISPDNNDDYNQYFVVDEKLLGARFEVLNRWAKPVYWSDHYDNRWDGQGLPSGVYFYTIQGACTEPRKGTITIMR